MMQTKNPIFRKAGISSDRWADYPTQAEITGKILASCRGILQRVAENPPQTGSEMTGEEMLVRAMAIALDVSPGLRNSLLGLSAEKVCRRAMSPLMRLPLPSHGADITPRPTHTMVSSSTESDPSGLEFEMCQMCHNCIMPLILTTFDNVVFLCMYCEVPVTQVVGAVHPSRSPC
jgi:hypothetical protein